MNPDQHEMGGRCTDDLGLVVVVGQARITAPAIGDYPRARRRGPGNEGMKAARGEIPRSAPAGCDVARPRAIARPRRQCASCLAGCDLARLWSGLLRCGTVGWPHRSRPGPQAGCDPDRPWRGAACAAGARHSCNCRARAGPGVAGRRYRSSGWSRCERPSTRSSGASGCGCMIVPAVTEVSFPQAAHSQLARRRFSSQPLSWPQAGADEAVGPALGCEMPRAGGFIGKARLEGGAGHRAVVLPAAGHDGTLGEHSADGNRKPNMSSNRVQRDKPSY